MIFRSVEKHGDTSPLLDVADSASGNTPLMYATMANKVHLLELMVSLGSQIAVANKVSSILYFVWSIYGPSINYVSL